MRITKAYCAKRASEVCADQGFDPSDGWNQLLPRGQRTFTRQQVDTIVRRAMDYGRYRELQRLAEGRG